MDDNNELIIYVLQQLRQGVPEQVVRATLAQNGWPQPLIDRAFSMVQQARPHEVTPSTQYDTAPATHFVGQPTQQQQPGQLPTTTPITNELPAALKPSKPEKKNRRGLIVGIIITLVVLAMAAGAAFFVLNSNNTADRPQDTTVQEQVNSSTDVDRKKNLENLSKKLEAYYNDKDTYPTLAAINDPAFATTAGGFEIKVLSDPAWNSKKSPCVSKEATPLFAETRTEGCFSYRSTASNGGECNGVDIKCTRTVVTATLQDKKPFVIALDQNKREE